MAIYCPRCADRDHIYGTHSAAVYRCLACDYHFVVVEGRPAAIVWHKIEKVSQEGFTGANQSSKLEVEG